MSTSANQADGVPLWKQEVNRRLAEHKSRKGLSAEPEALAEDQRGAGSRAAEIAARVAARYAKAPRYSEMLAGEARAAVRAAEAASLAAQEAQAAAEAVLAGLEAAPGAEPASAREKHGQGGFEVIEDGREAGEPALDGQDASGGVIGIQIVEAAQPMHAHLIEFPRALVAERKVRPQRAGGPHAAAGERQLSIFEVDPGGILIQSAAAEAEAEAAAAEWSGPEWLGMKLAEEPAQVETGTQEERVESAPAATAPHLAPINRRLLAAVVDGALITGALLAAALAAAIHAQELPSLHEIELGAAAALAVMGVLYHVLFFTLAEATPGMKYAGLGLCTFDGEKTTRVQRYGRLGALLLSLLPVGLGVAWAIFDEEHLSWHDRLSRTYLRKG